MTDCLVLFVTDQKRFYRKKRLDFLSSVGKFVHLFVFLSFSNGVRIFEFKIVFAHFLERNISKSLFQERR